MEETHTETGNQRRTLEPFQHRYMTLGTLRAVCHLWRDIVDATPTLWSRLHAKLGPSCIERCLSHSGVSPLHIEVDVTTIEGSSFESIGRSSPPAEVRERRLNRFLQTVVPHAQRWKSLVVTGDYEIKILCQGLQHVPLPNLQQFSVTPVIVRTSGSEDLETRDKCRDILKNLVGSTTLCHVELEQVLIPLSSSYLHNLYTLHLHLYSGTDTSPDDLHAMLSVSRNTLRRLTLNIAGWPNEKQGFNMTTQLPSLEHFTLAFRCDHGVRQSWDILGSFVLPRTVAFSLEGIFRHSPTRLQDAVEHYLQARYSDVPVEAVEWEFSNKKSPPSALAYAFNRFRKGSSGPPVASAIARVSFSGGGIMSLAMFGMEPPIDAFEASFDCLIHTLYRLHWLRVAERMTLHCDVSSPYHLYIQRFTLRLHRTFPGVMSLTLQRAFTWPFLISVETQHVPRTTTGYGPPIWIFPNLALLQVELPRCEGEGARQGTIEALAQLIPSVLKKRDLAAQARYIETAIKIVTVSGVTQQDLQKENSEFGSHSPACAIIFQS